MSISSISSAPPTQTSAPIQAAAPPPPPPPKTEGDQDGPGAAGSQGLLDIKA